MRHIENLIFVVLIFCIFIGARFWYQVSRIAPPQSAPAAVAAPPKTSETLPLVLSILQLPPISLPTNRDIFQLPWRKEDNIPLPPPPEEKKPFLSTIVWSDAAPRAIINGEILALGEIDSQSQFRVESITREHVQVHRIKDKKSLRLALPPDEPDNKGSHLQTTK